jgi:hypothetical protein
VPGELWAADREELRDTGDTADFADTAAAPAAGPDCTRVTGRCAATRAGLCEDTDDADVPEAVAVVVSAEAAPAPASAAPTPRVTAPAPSQAYGIRGRREPGLRRVLADMTAEPLCCSFCD